MRRLLLACCAVLLCSVSIAKEATPMAADEAIEKRMVKISDELRCLVCQNESLSGSHADLAKDLRREIRKLIAEGKTDREILDFMVARYGDFVLYRPPVKASTMLLWGGPFLFMGAGLLALILFLRRRNQLDQSALSADEQRRASALLDKPPV